METAENFYQVLTQKMPLADFEAWVYNTPELEAILSEDDYLTLISLNYKGRSAFYELQKLVSGYVNWAEVRRRELLEVLQTIVRCGSADDTLVALSETYNWYCRGYSFLQDIAFSFLSVDNDFDWDPEGKWIKLTENQKQRYISRFYPEARRLAEQLSQQLESGQIQLHMQGPDDEPAYIETDATAKAEEYEPLKNGEPPVKDWWQFWK